MLQVHLGIQMHLEQLQMHLARRHSLVMEGLVLSPDGHSFACIYASIGLLVIRSTMSLEETSRIQVDIGDPVYSMVIHILITWAVCEPPDIY